MRAEVAEYHYTLYYYDQAGNLVKTVPPAGVNLGKMTEPTVDSWHAEVEAARITGAVKTVAHTMATEYRFNTLNQVVAQKLDAGTAGGKMSVKLPPRSYTVVHLAV